MRLALMCAVLSVAILPQPLRAQSAEPMRIKGTVPGVAAEGAAVDSAPASAPAPQTVSAPAPAPRTLNAPAPAPRATTAPASQSAEALVPAATAPATNTAAGEFDLPTAWRAALTNDPGYQAAIS